MEKEQNSIDNVKPNTQHEEEMPESQNNDLKKVLKPEILDL